MQALVVLAEGVPMLRVGAYAGAEAHAVIGAEGYPALLWPLRAESGLDDGALVLAVTPWTVCLRLPPFEGMIGGTKALWDDAALPAVATDETALLLQTTQWLAACRRFPTLIDAGSGLVGRARRELARRLAAWTETRIVRIAPPTAA